jgi:hypothetical protein
MALVANHSIKAQMLLLILLEERKFFTDRARFIFPLTIIVQSSYIGDSWKGSYEIILRETSPEILFSGLLSRWPSRSW